MSRTTTPEHIRWLKANHHNLGMLTGTDWRALEAIDACWRLYVNADDPGVVLHAVRLLLQTMQQKCWHLPRQLIARAMDWGDIDRLWPMPIESGPLETPP